MNMMTLRLDEQLEQQVSQAALKMGVSKSELVRQSLTSFIQQQEKVSPWELGQGLFGNYESPISNLAEDRKMLLKHKLAAKMNQQR